MDFIQHQIVLENKNNLIKRQPKRMLSSRTNQKSKIFPKKISKSLNPH